MEQQIKKQRRETIIQNYKTLAKNGPHANDPYGARENFIAMAKLVTHIDGRRKRNQKNLVEFARLFLLCDNCTLIQHLPLRWSAR